MKCRLPAPIGRCLSRCRITCSPRFCRTVWALVLVLGFASFGVWLYQSQKVSVDEIELNADLTLEERIERDLGLLANSELSDGQKTATLVDLADAYGVMGEDELRIKAYKEALTFTDYNFVALNNLAVYYKRQGDWATAAEYIRPLLEKNPENMDVIQDALKILCKAGDKVSVNLILNRYETLHADDPVAQVWVNEQRENVEVCRFL